MKAVKNIDKHDIDVSYNFFTYHFPKDIVVLVDSEDLVNYISTNLPLSFSFGSQLEAKKGEELPLVKKEKTKAYIKTEQDFKITENDMYVETEKPEPTFGKEEELPKEGQVDKDGTEWYGEGISLDDGKS